MMTTFLNGPAKGQKFRCSRCPILLRVVKHKSTGKWDVLDQLADTPEDMEHVYLYMLTAPPSSGFWDGRDPKTGKRTGGAFQAGVYRLPDFSDPPNDAVLRDNEEWDAWCKRNDHRIRPEWAKET